MPLLNLQSIKQVQAPDGTISFTSAPEELIPRGPVFQVTVGLEENLAAQLLQQRVTQP